ncbi:DUF6338 family protein [Streptomyces sp. NBC_01235]|uniref:DUF6338 family protein n=1 Tax=Streptomyces sp. NBC_01235 TaxID=2903788 RepID=UPI002E14FB41|nr:DUF6338 family protein [Streptomyces sp. NBC_01235]
MPTSVVALVVLLVSAAPGYVYVRIVEVRRPRRRRTSLLELVDLVCVGAVGSAVGTLVVLLPAPHWTALLPLEGLLKGSPYLTAHPWQAIWSGVLAFVISLVVAASAGTVVARYGGTAVRHTPSPPLRRAVELTPPGHSLWLAVELTDGRLWEGKLLSMDGERDTLGEGDLVLQWPLAVTEPGKERRHHPARFVAIPGPQIVLVHGADLPRRPRTAAPEPVSSPEASRPDASGSAPAGP